MDSVSWMYAFYASEVLLLVLGFLGAFLPVLPGPPLSFCALLIGYLVSPGLFSGMALFFFGLLTILISAADYVAPVWLAKKGGGSKEAVWGTAIGTVVGLFFLPLGLVVCPFLGAFLGERYRKGGASFEQSLRVAAFSLVAFLLTTGAKLLLSGAIAVYMVVSLLHG